MNDILKTTMAVIAAIAVMAAVFVPMTMEFGEQAHYTTNRNEGGYYTLVENDKKVVVEIDGTSATATINGKEYDVYSYGTYLVSDFALMGYVPQNDGYHSVFTVEKNYKINVNKGSSDKLTLTFNNGEVVMDDGTDTYTGTYTYLLHYSGGSGNYIQFNNSTTLNVNRDSRIFFISNGGTYADTIIGGPYKAGALSGSAKNYTNGTDNVPVAAATTISWTLTDNGNQSYKITNPIYGPDSTAIVSGIIPVKYQVYNEDSMVAFMVNILPVLIGLAFLAGIGMYITRFKNV